MIKVLKEKDFSKVVSFLKNNFSSPTHWPEWNILVSKYYHSKFYYYVEYEAGEIIGICPVHKVENGIFRNNFSGQFNFLPNGGWIFNNKHTFNLKTLPLSNLNAFVSFALPQLDEFNVNYNHKNTNNALTLIVDLTLNLDDIWKKDIHSKRRNMIRKAEKSNIVIEVDDKTDLRTFYNNYVEANKLYDLKSLKFEFFEDLFKNTPNVNFDILWAKKDNEILSGVVVVYDKNYSIYWLGFSANNSKNLGQGDILQWEVIKRMKEYGCKYYDLCYIEKDRLPHIYKFKKGFSSTEVPIDVLIKKTFSYKFINKLQKIFYAKK